jgi:hypothetical protein
VKKYLIGVLCMAALLALSSDARACNGTFVMGSDGSLQFIPAQSFGNGFSAGLGTFSAAGNGFQFGLGATPLNGGVFALSTGAGNSNVNIGGIGGRGLGLGRANLRGRAFGRGVAAGARRGAAAGGRRAAGRGGRR